jgi:cob(I)alamin adenosyltransferase
MRNGGGRVITYYGSGDGKTCAALGHAVRASGQDRKVVVFHFLKGRKDVGEYKFFVRDAENIEVHLCGKPEFFYPDTDPRPYVERINKCMSLIEEIITDTKCDMLILDEVLYAIEFGLVEEERLTNILTKGYAYYFNWG